MLGWDETAQGLHPPWAGWSHTPAPAAARQKQPQPPSAMQWLEPELLEPERCLSRACCVVPLPMPPTSWPEKNQLVVRIWSTGHILASLGLDISCIPINTKPLNIVKFS